MESKVETTTFQGGEEGQDSSSSWNNTMLNSLVTDASVAASSMNSGFDLISLSGESKRRCKRCSLFNRNVDGVCEGCGLALVANPSMDSDAQIAMNLQRKEEQLAFMDLKTEEDKREIMSEQPILFRAQILADDIMTLVESCKSVEKDSSVGFSTLAVANLVILASRFIEFVEESPPYHPLLCYCFTEKLGRLEKISHNGFGLANEKFSTNVEAALQASLVEPTLPSLTEMSAIPKNSQKSKPERIGWITAIAGDTREEEIEMKNETAFAYTLKESDQSLPLVYFDASLRSEDVIRRLANGLERVCIDFFQCYNKKLQQRHREEIALQVARQLAQHNFVKSLDSSAGKDNSDQSPPFSEAQVGIKAAGPPSQLKRGETIAPGITQAITGRHCLSLSFCCLCRSFGNKIRKMRQKREISPNRKKGSTRAKM